MRDLFLANAAIVLAAVRDQRVADTWDEASELNDQPDQAIDFETAADYFAPVASALTDDDHAAISARGAAVAARGHAGVVDELGKGLDRLRRTLPNEPADRRVAVFAGKVMRLDDYPWTRLVEQVVHRDDLARSLGIEPWATAPDADALVIACGAEIGRRRHGGTAMIRTLPRGHRGALPVL